MAKAKAAAAAQPAVAAAVVEAAASYKVGDLVEFVGYSDPSMTEDQKILVPGQILKITAVKGDDGYEAVQTDVEQPLGDTVFPEEVKAAPTTAAGEKQAAKVEKLNTPAASKSDKKAAAKVTEAAEKATPAPAAEKPAKGKGKTAEAAPAATVAEPDAPVAASAPAAQRVVDGQVVTVEDTAAVAKLLREHDALTAAKQLVQQQEETYFALGGVLNHIYTEGTFKLAGYEGKRGFETYVETELGVAYRKAMYLIGIYTYFRSLGVDEKRLAEIGWSKAKELVGVATPENFDEFVNFAADHSREQLKAHIASSSTSAGDGTGSTQIEKKRFTFVLHGDAATGVDRALNSAMGSIEGDPTNKLSMAFEMIVTEWAMTREGVEVSMEDALVAVETRFGIRLGLLDENGELLAEEGPLEEGAQENA
jgi:hypothetical protein